MSVFLYVFDVLWLDGHDVRALPLRSRKRLLRAALDFRDPVRLTPHRNRDGEALYEEACRKGWEGLIAKRADSPYTDVALARLAEVQVRGPGARDRRLHRAEGLARGAGRAAARVLRRRARCATRARSAPGSTGATLPDLGERLTPLRREPLAVRRRGRKERAVTWVEPRLVAQVGFTEWTRDGRLRHPRFLGLRFDKSARRWCARDRPRRSGSAAGT